MNSELHSVPSCREQRAHLTEIEFGEILSGCTRAQDFAPTPAEKHLLTCEECAAELESLRESLMLFREASTAYTRAELRRIPPVVLPARPAILAALRPIYLAAAALALAALLPMQLGHQRSRAARHPAASTAVGGGSQHYATESNEVLLEDVDQAASASVPEAMQALADPAAANDLSVQKSN